MKYLPTSDADRKEMLAAIGVSSVDEFFAAVPASVRQSPNLPPPLSEIEIRRLLRSLAKQNANARESAPSFSEPASTTTTPPRLRIRCCTDRSG